MKEEFFENLLWFGRFCLSTCELKLIRQEILIIPTVHDILRQVLLRQVDMIHCMRNYLDSHFDMFVFYLNVNKIKIKLNGLILWVQLVWQVPVYLKEIYMSEFYIAAFLKVRKMDRKNRFASHVDRHGWINLKIIEFSETRKRLNFQNLISY